MATSNKLTDKRLKEIAALPVTYDDDIPVLEALKAQGERLPNKNKFYSERGCFP